MAPPTNCRCSDDCNCGMIASGVPQTTMLLESINKVYNILQAVVTASHNTSTETQEGLLSLESRMRDELPTLICNTITKQFEINGQRIIGDHLFDELTKTISSGITNGFAQLNDSLVTQESVGGRIPDNSLEDQSMREEQHQHQHQPRSVYLWPWSNRQSKRNGLVPENFDIARRNLLTLFSNEWFNGEAFKLNDGSIVLTVPLKDLKLKDLPSLLTKDGNSKSQNSNFNRVTKAMKRWIQYIEDEEGDWKDEKIDNPSADPHRSQTYNNLTDALCGSPLIRAEMVSKHCYGFFKNILHIHEDVDLEIGKCHEYSAVTIGGWLQDVNRKGPKIRKRRNGVANIVSESPEKRSNGNTFNSVNSSAVPTVVSSIQRI